MTTLVCERCWSEIDRSSEPMRLIPHRVTDGESGEVRRLQSAVHARACTAPDPGAWNPIRRGVAPAAMRWANEQADHR
ncbi:hypothetical protein EV383_3474 [Pseudonocardia sediminis]|uniref:Uncharacterized protein n=1 Tax=Pseudonocardia sediminis TaxID=1397368 RepID=A0A4Q7UX04_PSEST|nr:hypothetical protein [Pseudonocardia sediminis]RZT86577.1 hypothetical protein EV383_3474 [Pseudonocardia sediminis]